MVYTYEAKFGLTNPVNDFNAAQHYLSEDPMIEYLRDSLDYYHIEMNPDDLLSIDWILKTDHSGVIQLKSAVELSHEVLNSISEWVSGQNSDGLGEGFEQQDFATICDVDEWGDTDWDTCEMASFDWETNDYRFKLVKQEESKSLSSKVKLSEAEKLQHSVLVVVFDFDDELTDTRVYKATKNWLQSLKLKVFVSYLSEFPAQNIKRAEIEMNGISGFLFKVYTTVDLTTVSDSIIKDIDSAVEKFVFSDLLPEYQLQPFGKKVEYREISSRPNLRGVMDESKHRNRSLIKTTKPYEKGLKKARRGLKRHLMEGMIDLNKFNEKDSQDLGKKGLTPDQAETGKPVSIKPEYGPPSLMITFVNTEKNECLNWVKDFLKKNNIPLVKDLEYSVYKLPKYTYNYVKAFVAENTDTKSIL